MCLLTLLTVLFSLAETDKTVGICQFDYWEQNSAQVWTNTGMWLLRQVSATRVLAFGWTGMYSL